MRLDARVMRAGHCLHLEALAIRGGSWRPCTFPALFALLIHPHHGPILFDTGYADHLHQAVRLFPSSLYSRLLAVRFNAYETATFQLSSLGIKPRDVRHIIISHFHPDHIAGLKDFPSARLICSQEGWHHVRSKRGFDALMAGFLPELLPDDIEDRIDFLKPHHRLVLSNACMPFTSGYDIFGDGSVIAVELPGHAVGQIGVIYQDMRGNSNFLIADAAWSRRAYRNISPPPLLVQLLTGRAGPYQRTLHCLHELGQRNTHMRIIPSHCMEAWQEQALP